MNIIQLSLPSPEFLKELSPHGPSRERIFPKHKTRHNLKFPGSTPSCLSIDFYSRQSGEPGDRNCYVIRTGKGNFVIFDENRHGKTYCQASLFPAFALKRQPMTSLHHFFFFIQCIYFCLYLIHFLFVPNFDFFNFFVDKQAFITDSFH